MFKYHAIKKYGVKLLPVLEKRYGKQDYFTPSQIRTCVYQKNFSPKYLPLGYLLFANHQELQKVIATEFPQLDLNEFKHEVQSYLSHKNYQGYLQVLGQS